MGTILTLFFYLFLVLGTSYSVKRVIKKHKKTKYWELVAIVAAIAFVSSMRGSLGTDTQMYIDAYTLGTESISRWVNFEPGFRLTVNVFSRLGLPHQIFFFVVNFLTMLFAFLTIDNEKKDVNIFLAAFLCMIDFYFLSWNIVRQALAISMSIFGMCLFLDKKMVKGTFFIVLASLFHTSALVCFVIIMANYIFETKRYKLFLGLAMIIALYLTLNRDIIANVVYKVTHQSYYAQFFSRYAATEGGLLTYFIKIAPIIGIAILGYKNYENKPKYKVMFSLMLLGYIFSSIGAVTDTQIQRIGYYFTYLIWLVLGRVGAFVIRVNRKKNLSGNYTSLLIIFFELLLFIFNRFIKGYGELVPFPWFML